MTAIWQELTAGQQDALILLALLAPVLVAGVVVLRGYAPGTLVRALLWRFRWANLVFVLLIAISVGMGIGLLAQERGLRKGMAQAADKFDLVVSAPDSELTMLFATVFLQPTDVPLLDGETYNAIADHPRVEIAAPLAFGDSYEGAPVIGTTAAFVEFLSDGRIEGRNFERPFEAVIGAGVPLGIGETFVPAHGVGDSAEDGAHFDEHVVVGRMARSGSPWDTAVVTAVESVWAVHGLASGRAPPAPGEGEVTLAAAGIDERIGPPYDAEYFPGTPAIVVRADSLAATYALRSQFNQDTGTMAFFPGAVLANLYNVMGDVRQAMSLMATVTQVLVAASVLLGLFILTRLFQRQLALLRAIGAPARFVFAVIWSYSASLLLAGAVLGLAVGYGASAILSRIVTERTDILVRAAIGWPEIHLVAAFVSVTAILSFVPTLMVLAQPAVRSLRS